jgi:diguanylate cyclase (GGDEF)-like protein
MRAFVDFENEQMIQEAHRADQMSAASRATITVLLVSALLTALLIGAVMAASILKELKMRYLVQERLRASYEVLEARVRDRTAELALVNETLMRRNLEITLFGQLDDSLQSCNTSDEAYGAIQVSMKQLFPEDSGVLFTFGGTARTSKAAAVWGDAPPVERVFSIDDCWALRRGRVHGRTDIEAGLRCRHVEAGHTAYLCVPMIAHGAALGVLHVLLASSDSERWEVRQNLAIRVGEHLGMALAKLEMQETLRQLSVRDPLTGLFNRRYMEESLDRELRRAEREGKPIGIIMLDIDHFKVFNDTFGHDAGDALLRELGVLLPQEIRSSDIACRYGGEEFTVILPDASIDMTRQRAERIREVANRMRVRYGERVLDSVTLSLGVAAFPQNGVSCEVLIKDADVALYRAKNEGRDRVCVAESQAQSAMSQGRLLSFIPTT